MQHIMDNPVGHHQGYWWCGSSGCFAGWALFLSGRYSYDDLQDLVAFSFAGSASVFGNRAQELLGLTSDERRKLFHGWNSREMLQLMVKDLVNGDTLQDLEDVLIRADLGMETALRVTGALAASRYGKDVSDTEVRAIMAAEGGRRHALSARVVARRTAAVFTVVRLAPIATPGGFSQGAAPLTTIYGGVGIHGVSIHLERSLAL